MTEITHEPACEALRAAGRAWRERWANHCQQCQGYGAVLSGSPLPEEPISAEPCAACIEADRCPRCGLAVDWAALESAWTPSNPTTCIHCGWTMDNPDADPTPDACLCGLEPY